MRCGHDVKVGHKKIKRSFERLMGNSARRPISGSQMARVEVVLAKFSRIPFRALDIFDVCLESGISVLSLLTSYVLVLLQFKVAESRSYRN